MLLVGNQKGYIILNLHHYMVLFFKIKYFECNIGIKLGNTPIAVEQNNCTNKTLNAYVVYDLDN